MLFCPEAGVEVNATLDTVGTVCAVRAVPVDPVGPRSLPFGILCQHLDLVGPARTQACDRAGPGRTGVGPIGERAAVAFAILHMVVS